MTKTMMIINEIIEIAKSNDIDIILNSTKRKISVIFICKGEHILKTEIYLFLDESKIKELLNNLSITIKSKKK